MSTATAVGVPHQVLEPQDGAWSGADWLMAGVLCGVAVLLPALLALATGSFSLPQNDDWSYRRIAEHFAQTGHVVSNGWPSMTLIGQLLWSWPFLRVFGDHGWVYTFSTVVLSAIGVFSAYFIARRVLARSWAAAAVLLVAAVPGFAWSTSTFMTDMPAFAAELACLALGLAALDHRGRRRWAFLGGALVVGVFGFAIREFALVAPVAVLVGVGAGDTPRRRYWYLVVGALMLVVVAVIFSWWSHLPGFLHETFAIPVRGSVILAAHGYYTVAFLLSPAVVFCAWRRLRLRLSWATVTTVAVVALGVEIDRHFGPLFTGNYLDPQGTTGGYSLYGGRPTLLPGPLWDLLRGIGIVSGGLLAGIAVTVDRRALRRWQSSMMGTPIGVIWIFSIVAATGMFLFVLTDYGLYDRYLWSIVFAFGVLLLHYSPPVPPASWPRFVTGIIAALSVLLVLVSTALTVNADSYSVARWHAGQIAVSLGVPANEVDAGFEWVGAHASGVANVLEQPSAPNYEPFYALVQPGFRDCAVVSNAPLDYPELHFVRTTSYDLLGFVGSRPLYIYKSSAPGC